MCPSSLVHRYMQRKSFKIIIVKHKNQNETAICYQFPKLASQSNSQPERKSKREGEQQL